MDDDHRKTLIEWAKASKGPRAEGGRLDVLGEGVQKMVSDWVSEAFKSTANAKEGDGPFMHADRAVMPKKYMADWDSISRSSGSPKFLYLDELGASGSEPDSANSEALYWYQETQAARLKTSEARADLQTKSNALAHARSEKARVERMIEELERKNGELRAEVDELRDKVIDGYGDWG